MDKAAIVPASETSQAKTVETSSTALTEVSHASGKAVVESANLPIISTIAELQPTSYNKVIEVRAYRKWISVTYGKKQTNRPLSEKKETGYCCILIDREV